MYLAGYASSLSMTRSCSSICASQTRKSQLLGSNIRYDPTPSLKLPQVSIQFPAVLRCAFTAIIRYAFETPNVRVWKIWRRPFQFFKLQGPRPFYIFTKLLELGMYYPGMQKTRVQDGTYRSICAGWDFRVSGSDCIA
jgi:hypothetical protein